MNNETVMSTLFLMMLKKIMIYYFKHLIRSKQYSLNDWCSMKTI